MAGCNAPGLERASVRRVEDRWWDAWWTPGAVAALALAALSPVHWLWPDRLSALEGLCASFAAGMGWGVLCLRRAGRRVAALAARSQAEGDARRAAEQEAERRRWAEAQRDELADRLREAQDFTDTILSSARVGIIVYDRDLRYRVWNRMMEELSGRPAADVLGKVGLDVFPHLREQGVDVLQRRALAGETVRSGDMRYYVEETGRKGWFTGVYSPHVNAHGEVIGVVVTIHDITERKHAEEELRKSENRLRTLIAQMPSGFALHKVVWDDDGRPIDYRFVDVNPGVEMLTGRRREELIGKTLNEALGQVSALWMNALARVALTGRPEHIESHSDILGLWVEGRVFRPEPGHVAIVLNDVTERYEAEEARRASEERLRLVVENASDVICLLDADLRIQHISPSVKRHLGYAPSELIGESVVERLVALRHREDVRRDIANMLRGERRAYPVYELVGKDGRPRFVEVSGREIRRPGHPLMFLAAARDITERMRLEEELRQAQKMEAVGVLAAGVAHDFNNLMTPILGYARLLADRLPEDDPRRGFADRILKTATRAAALPRQLLAFSRRQGMKLEPVDVNALILDMNKMLDRVIGEQIRLETRLAPESPRILADPVQVEQVLLNLVINAREAMPDGGRLTISTEPADDPGVEGPAVCLAVADTGVGMDADTMESIFEPYYTTKNMANNTGLGLAVAYGIMKQHGGVIRAESEPGKGATFRAYFPAAAEDSAEDSPAQDAASPPTGRGEGVLLVEDDDYVREFLEGTLREAGYKVIACASARQAREAFHADPARIDLLFADVMLPDAKDLAWADELAQCRPGLRIIATSGYPTEEHEGPRRRFLPKPVIAPDLLRAAREALDEE